MQNRWCAEYTHCIVYIQECFAGHAYLQLLYEEKNKKESNEFSKI
jgi:hypothetical protein